MMGWEKKKSVMNFSPKIWYFILYPRKHCLKEKKIIQLFCMFQLLRVLRLNSATQDKSTTLRIWEVHPSVQLVCKQCKCITTTLI